jgi:hypothetical protein
MKLRHFYPLIGFVIPTVVIGYGVVIPRSCIAGINDLTIGFATTVIGACLPYGFGVRTVTRDLCPPTCPSLPRRPGGENAHATP